MVQGRYAKKVWYRNRHLQALVQATGGGQLMVCVHMHPQQQRIDNPHV